MVRRNFEILSATLSTAIVHTDRHRVPSVALRGIGGYAALVSIVFLIRVP